MSRYVENPDRSLAGWSDIILTSSKPKRALHLIVAEILRVGDLSAELDAIVTRMDEGDLSRDTLRAFVDQAERDKWYGGRKPFILAELRMHHLNG